MSRPSLNETGKFLGCRDQDSSRLRNLLDVETMTSRDWTKDVDTVDTGHINLPLAFSPLITWIAAANQNRYAN